MKITFVLPYAGLSGGIRVVAIYAERLMQRGHEVMVVSIPLPPAPWRDRIKMLLRGQWISRMESQSYFDGSKVPHRVLDRCRPVEDGDVPDADIVVATWWETAEWVARLSREKGAKAYFVQHDERTMYINDLEMGSRVRATWSLPLYKITISKWLVDLLAAETGESIDLISNSVDHELFHSPPRDKHRTPGVGLMYSAVPFKGVDVSLRAIDMARKTIPNLRVTAYGHDDPQPDLPLPQGTEYYRQPAQTEIKDIYAKCDVWLFGSRCEGFGLPILEAMSCRTPVIGTPAGAAPQLLSEGGGILIPPDSPAEMAEAIERIARMSNDEWRRMSDAAHKTATSYTWDDATDLFEAALEKAIARDHDR